MMIKLKGVWFAFLWIKRKLRDMVGYNRVVMFFCFMV